MLCSFKEAKNEGKRRGASRGCEPAGIRVLGSTVFVVLMALGGDGVCYASKGAAELGIGMHLSTFHELNLKKRRVVERSPRAIKASLLDSGTRFTPEKSSE